MTKWEELTHEEQDWWNKFTEEHQSYLRLYKVVVENPRCLWCRFKNPGRFGALDFHVRSTHGFSIHNLINFYLEKHD